MKDKLQKLSEEVGRQGKEILGRRALIGMMSAAVVVLALVIMQGFGQNKKSYQGLPQETKVLLGHLEEFVEAATDPVEIAQAQRKAYYMMLDIEKSYHELERVKALEPRNPKLWGQLQRMRDKANEIKIASDKVLGPTDDLLDKLDGTLWVYKYYKEKGKLPEGGFMIKNGFRYYVFMENGKVETDRTIRQSLFVEQSSKTLQYLGAQPVNQYYEFNYDLTEMEFEVKPGIDTTYVIWKDKEGNTLW